MMKSILTGTQMETLRHAQGWIISSMLLHAAVLVHANLVKIQGSGTDQALHLVWNAGYQVLRKDFTDVKMLYKPDIGGYSINDLIDELNSGQDYVSVDFIQNDAPFNESDFLVLPVLAK